MNCDWSDMDNPKEEPKSNREEFYESIEKQYEKPIIINIPFDPVEQRRKIETASCCAPSIGNQSHKDFLDEVKAASEILEAAKIKQEDNKKESFLSGAVRDVQEGKLRYDLLPLAALKRMALLYAEGAKKYGEDNWQKGIPYKRIVSSVLRHLMSLRERDKSEDHAAAVAWGMFAIMYYDEQIEKGKLPKELNDLE